MYAADGRPSIPPEYLLKGCMLMALYSIRSEPQFRERLQCDLPGAQHQPPRRPEPEWAAECHRRPTVGHLGYLASQRLRKRVEEIFAWWKTVAAGRKLRYVGHKRNQLWVELTCAAYNLVRMANLCPAAA
jgi:Transposase DDE domain/Transposase domain (DUF772)